MRRRCPLPAFEWLDFTWAWAGPYATMQLAYMGAKAGAEGKLFGSIGTSDLAEACTREGFKVERSEVRLPQGPLRTVGEHVVSLHLHADVDVPLHVTIVAEE